MQFLYFRNFWVPQILFSHAEGCLVWAAGRSTAKNRLGTQTYFQCWLLSTRLREVNTGNTPAFAGSHPEHLWRSFDHSGTSHLGHLYSGERDTFFRAPKPRFKLHSGNTLVLKTWLTTKRDKLERQRFTVMTAFTAWKISIKPINSQYGRETLIVIFYTLFSCLKWWPDSEAELEIQWNL